MLGEPPALAPGRLQAVPKSQDPPSSPGSAPTLVGRPSEPGAGGSQALFQDAQQPLPVRLRTKETWVSAERGDGEIYLSGLEEGEARGRCPPTTGMELALRMAAALAQLRTLPSLGDLCYTTFPPPGTEMSQETSPWLRLLHSGAS